MFLSLPGAAPYPHCAVVAQVHHVSRWQLALRARASIFDLVFAPNIMMLDSSEHRRTETPVSQAAPP